MAETGIESSETKKEVNPETGFTKETEIYFDNLGKDIEETYDVAHAARKKGYDPVNAVEVPLALTMAAKVVRLIATVYPQLDNEDIINRVLELEKKYGALDNTVSFKIAEEIAKEKYCKFETQLEAMDAGIRVGFAYTTLGVVSSPIEGYTEIKTGKTKIGETYLKCYFSGPIRSAGTTAGCVGLMLIDYIRQIFGYAKYDPTEDECKRLVTELYDYHERVTNLQYLPTEEEAHFIAKNIPIQVCGDPTESKEVSNFKNLPRIDTDFIRGGFCLIIGEGLAQKAAKGLRILRGMQKNGLTINDWEWLEDYVALHKKREKGTTDTSPTYIKDLVAGRPVFGHPAKGFRFRYGRSRIAGFSAVSIHPATMGVTNDFLATGTQLKIERPTKGCVVTPCDTIDGPIVKFKNGSVKQLDSYEEAKELYPEIEEILYLGDLLFPLGDVMNRNAVLVKPGYVEEWWVQEVEKAGGSVADYTKVSFDEATKISEKYDVPLYPKYIFFWTQLNYELFLSFIDWMGHARVHEEKLLFPYNSTEKERFSSGKKALELLGIPHTIATEHVVLDSLETKSLLINTGFLENHTGEIHFTHDFKKVEEKTETEGEANNSDNEIAVLGIINELSKYKIQDKAGEFIGSRMGRPEKAKLRRLTGSPNILFPVGNEGGRLRSVNETVKKGTVKGEFPYFYCEGCKRETIYKTCEVCDKPCTQRNYCKMCDKDLYDGEECTTHKMKLNYKTSRIDMKHFMDHARKKIDMLRVEVPPLIKGVRGTSSEDHDLEHLVKGILRAKHNLCVNKDGTTRYDMTELPISHFKAKEIEVSVAKLKELGYTTDCYGKPLERDDQILELKPHDILLPCNTQSGDERTDDVFLNITKFIDELLVHLYGLPKFYNTETRDDLVGVLGVCMAPHNCAGVICRIIGFSKVQGLLASPYMHAAMRRDCFDYESYMSIKEGEHWRIKKIGEVVEALNPTKKVDNYGTKEKKVKNIHTIGYTKKVSEVSVNNFTKHTKTPMVEIQTALGKKIRVTENHKFFINNKTKRATDLKIGDMLPLPRKITIKEKPFKTINLLELLENEEVMVRDIGSILEKIPEKEITIIIKKAKITKKSFQNFKRRNSFPVSFIKELPKKIKEQVYKKGSIAAKRDTVKTPILVNLESKDLLEIIGLYVAEGYSRTVKGKKGLNQVYIASSNATIRSYIKKTIKKHFNLNPSERKNDRVTYSSKVLYLFFTKILETGSIAKEKRIPYLLLNAPLEKVACVLRGYFEGDGSAEEKRKKVSCDSVSEGLLQDLEFCLARFGIFAKRYTYKKVPGSKLQEFYKRKKRDIPEFEITKLIIGADFLQEFKKIGFLSQRKKKRLQNYTKMKESHMKIKYDKEFVYDPVVSIEPLGEKESYCLNVNTKNHLVLVNGIISKQCDGDEAALMLLLDVLVNFSRKFLPSHRGGTQDAPLVLNGKVFAKEVDDQILDFELVNNYPLDLYEKAAERKHSSEVEIEMVKQRIGRNEDPYVNTGFTHDTDNFNMGAVCSSYKILPSMKDKVEEQMLLCEKLAAVDQNDVARLIIDRHFMRDLKGNLRKFSQQSFRCSSCNTIYRRPPMNGRCPCTGNIIFTISYGSIVKYMEPALDLTRHYNLPMYINQDLELTKKYIESIFGRDSEKQESIERWF